MLLDRKILLEKESSQVFGNVSLVLDFIQTSYEDAIIVLKTTMPITQEEQQNMNDVQYVER